MSLGRREFLGGAIAAFALKSNIFQASAQEPQSTAEATPGPFDYDFKDRIVTAARNFDSPGIRMLGAMKYGCAVDIYEGEKEAETAFKLAEDFLGKFLEETKKASDKPMTVGERKEMSAPKLGDTSRAETVTLTLDVFTLELILLFVQKGEILHRWVALGIANPAEEMFTLAKEHMGFEIDNVSNDDQVLALIPELKDMPEGFVLAEDGERVKREGT